jgi:hypothetical protein
VCMCVCVCVCVCSHFGIFHNQVPATAKECASPPHTILAIARSPPSYLLYYCFVWPFWLLTFFLMCVLALLPHSYSSNTLPPPQPHTHTQTRTHRTHAILLFHRQPFPNPAILPLRLLVFWPCPLNSTSDGTSDQQQPPAPLPRQQQQ